MIDRILSIIKDSGKIVLFAGTTTPAILAVILIATGWRNFIVTTAIVLLLIVAFVFFVSGLLLYGLVALISIIFHR